MIIEGVNFKVEDDALWIILSQDKAFFITENQGGAIELYYDNGDPEIFDYELLASDVEGKVANLIPVLKSHKEFR